MKLQFYKKQIPIELIKRVLVFAVTFFLAVIILELTTNRLEQKVAKEMVSSSLPIAYLTYFETNVTELHGYTTQMDSVYMRDALIPLEEDRSLTLDLKKSDWEIKSVSYQIKSLDEERYIMERSIDELQTNGNDIRCKIQLDNLIDKDTEYLLIINVAGEDERIVHYYTRVIDTTDANVKNCIAFAMYFHAKALSDDYGTLSIYIEPDGSMDNENLNYVNIHSSLTQIGYDQFNAKQVGQTSVTLTDISENFTAVSLTYQMERTHLGRKEVFNCSEYFRVKYGSERILLLDYQRRMEEILSPNGLYVDGKQVNLGITDSNVSYMSNETGTLVAFVHSGQLFLYDTAKAAFMRVFSFIGEDLLDTRATYDQHNIKILNIDESGTMDYAVYGYMNAGDHEGACGINVFRFDSITGESTERVFLESHSSYQILEATFSDLIYEASNNTFYIIVQGNLLRIDLNELSTSTIVSGLSKGTYAVSGQGRYLAYTKDVRGGEFLTVLDLQTSNSYRIESKAGELIKPLIFMDNDLVYGLSRYTDLYTKADKTASYPMYALKIVGVEGGAENVLMTYQNEGYLVDSVRLDNFTVYLNRLTRDEMGQLVTANTDTIKNSSGEQNKAVPISTFKDNYKEKTIIMNMSTSAKGDIEWTDRKLISAMGQRNVDIGENVTAEDYFVYVGNQVLLATDNLSKAIISADENMGIVVDGMQEYVWKRGRKNYVNSFKGLSVAQTDRDATQLAMCISAMLSRENLSIQVGTLLNAGESPVSVLNKTMGDFTILDLTGIDLTEALYYVNIGNPVLAVTSDDEGMLIIGYDASTIIVYNPIQNVNNRYSISEMRKVFEERGNRFISYIK